MGGQTHDEDTKPKWYRPLVKVQAMQWLPGEPVPAMKLWVGEQQVAFEQGWLSGEARFAVLEAEDWIVKGWAGLFFVCKRDVFKEQYEAVPDAPDVVPAHAAT